MALYLVLRHPRNPEQVWSNSWQPDNRLVDAIMTTREVARLCEEAHSGNEYVYIHRCAWAGDSPEITCRSKISRVDPVDRDWLISFETPDPMAVIPSVHPQQGDNYYHAEDLDTCR